MKSQFYNTGRGGERYVIDNNRIDLAVRIFNDLVPSNFLDVGCGDGSFMELLKCKKIIYEGTGIEISPRLAETARAKGFRVISLDLDDDVPMLDENSFDACFLGDVIEHLFKPERTLQTVKRVLKPQGHLLLTTPNLAAWFNRIGLLFGYQPVFSEVSEFANAGHFFEHPGLPVGHLRLYTLRALLEIIKRDGFTIQQVYGIGINEYNREGLNRLAVQAINRLFSSAAWSSSFAILARKD